MSESISSSEIVFISEMDAFSLKQRSDEWFFLLVLPPIHTSPPHIIHTLYTYHWYYSVYEYYQNIPLSIRSTSWMGRYHSAYEKLFLTMYFVETGFMVNPSTINNTGIGVFEVIDFGKGETVF